MGSTIARLLINWKSSTGGFAAIVAGIKLLQAALVPLMDDDPETLLSWNALAEAVVAIAAGIGLIFARDADKSSVDNNI